MKTNNRLKIAIQKKGRLFNESTQLLQQCGLRFSLTKPGLLTRAENLPIDLLLVRDDDIPNLIMDGVCDLGIVGENVLYECALRRKCQDDFYEYKILESLGFGTCRLSIAIPKAQTFDETQGFDGKSIATTYPHLLKQYLEKSKQATKILTISGSVEIAPRLGMADMICDLVSTGKTLEENNLQEALVIMKSQAVLIQSASDLDDNKSELIALLLRRIRGVIAASESKYIMFHAPKDSLDTIKGILPGFEAPTIMPIAGLEDKVAIHVVSQEAVFWETLEKLKQIGASSILVLPVEKMLN